MSISATGDAARDASHALYHELAQKGWSKEEIYAVAGLTPDATEGGNLLRLTRKAGEK
jgi:hypothetical protein